MASRKEKRREALSGPIMRVAAEEAKTALAAAIAEQPDVLPPIPNVQKAHQTIYTRLEQVWVDACAGEYLVVQSKLAVLKLLCHVLGVDAAIKANAKRHNPQTSAADVVRHMQKLGLLVASPPDDTDCIPRRQVQLDATPPGAENPPSGRP